MKNWHALAPLTAALVLTTACADGPTSTSTAAVQPRAVDILSGPPLPGAIFTTISTCGDVNRNIYAAQGDVYLDGGPAHPGAAGLPDGEYYVQVTQPDGLLLGTSIGTLDETPAVVVGGEFQTCYQLAAILKRASDGAPGYDATNNPGGEYKVWVSNASDFANSSTKTDNFKIKAAGEGGGDPDEARLRVQKFYDADADGVWDATELALIGWRMRIQDGIDIIRFTNVDIIVDPDVYTVTESDPIQTNWVHTTTNPVGVTLANGDDKLVTFGNVCLGAGGGLTLGFWSNKNGSALIDATDLAMLTALNLRTAAGGNFDPGNYASFRTWILSANATNMAYMLSAQLAAMELNVFNGKVSGGALVYAPALLDPTFPATTGLSALGFISISDLMAAANTELGAHAVTIASGLDRSYQEALKTALDRGNNNLNFVQPVACAFSF